MDIQPKDRIIFPLDLPGAKEALRLAKGLSDHVGLFKIGLELFTSEGPQIVKQIQAVGPAGIFLDLKLHDIPATVTRALRAASRLGVDFVTIHADAGPEAIRGAAEVAAGTGTRILAVTVLTSLDKDTLIQLGYQPDLAEDMGKVVLRKAAMAREAGAHGIVCSGRELETIRANLDPELITIVPGIRPAWGSVSSDDQKRIATPRDAIRAGADYLVIGRPIRDAADPVEAAEMIAQEISEGL